MAMTREEKVGLMAGMLGRAGKALAGAAVDYLSGCRELPGEDEVMAALKVGRVRARQIASAARASTVYMLNTRPRYMGNADMVAWYLSDMKDLPVENLVVLTLAADNTLIGRHLCSTGSGHAAAVDPSAVYRFALMDGANSVIVAHNHPSGDPTPSEADVAFTRTLAGAGRAIRVRFLDSDAGSRRGVATIRALRREAFE